MLAAHLSCIPPKIYKQKWIKGMNVGFEAMTQYSTINNSKHYHRNENS